MKKSLRWIGKAMLRLGLIFIAASLGLVLLYRFVPVPATPLMIIRWVENAGTKAESNPIHKKWVPAASISKHAFQAVYTAEDQLFQEHRGFDWQSMKRAWESNKQGKKIRGGSTISQQTAKNVFLWPKRSYLRKALEAYFTALIELFWSKERILEVYLNVVEMGPGIYGIEAASNHYYTKSASMLARQEAARIAAILPNPRSYSVKNPSPYIQKRQAWILRQMTNLAQIPYGN